MSKQQSITIEIPDEYDRAVFDPKTNTIKYIKKDPPHRSRSWTDYCSHRNLMKREPDIISGRFSYDEPIRVPHFEAMEVEEVACRVTNSFYPAIRTLTELSFIRNEWVEDWKPKRGEIVYNIVVDTIKSLTVGVEDEYNVRVTTYNENRLLSFPSAAMAHEFIEIFKDEIIDIVRSGLSI